MHLLYGNGGMSIRAKSFVFDCLDRPQYRWGGVTLNPKTLNPTP
jgi:hypothetical protein